MKRLRKIISASTQELHYRLKEKIEIYKEYLGLLRTYKISQDYVQNETALLFGFEEDREKFRKYFRNNFAHEEERLINKAEKILNHQFDLLGYKNINIGDVIDWNYEYIRKIRIPDVHWSKIYSMSKEKTGDLKIVWELNRHQHLVTVAQVYFLTGDEKYPKEVQKQIYDWTKKNPPRRGPNWASSLEVSFRLISWIWILRLIKDSEVCTDDFIKDIKNEVGEHASHIERFLSIYSSPNTHLTGEALGLFYAGVFFPDLPQAARWRKKGEEILWKMLTVHLLSDGGYVERSLWYHQYTVNIYLHYFILLRNMGKEIPPWAWERLEQGITFIMYSLKPDRTVPLIGDDDGGYFLPLSTGSYDDASSVMAVAATLFGRGDFKAVAGVSKPEVLWLLGPEGGDAYRGLPAELPEETSKGFEATGYFFLRSGWSSEDNYMAFDCGEHGWLNGGHAHADLLSFQIVSGEQPLIVDPGTYAYTGEFRDYFRGPKSHNVLIVDERYPAIVSGPFEWSKIPNHKLLKWDTNDKYDYVSGLLDSSPEWKHIREILFLKPALFVFLDHVFGTGTHKVSIRLHLAGENWVIENGDCLYRDGSSSCIIRFVNGNNLEMTMTDAWISRVYGDKRASKMLIMKTMSELPCRIIYYIDLGKSQNGSRLNIGEVEDMFKAIRGERIESLLREIQE